MRLHRQFPLIVVLALVGASCGGTVTDSRQIAAVYRDGPLPSQDPRAAIWRGLPEHPVVLMTQDLTEPQPTRPGVTLVRVKGLNDGTSIVLRLEWADATRDVLPDSGRSSDAVAVQFAVQSGADLPSPAMGEAGKPVDICFWKALWQDDIERAPGGIDRMTALYPRMAVDPDAYPFAANPAAREEMARR